MTTEIIYLIPNAMIDDYFVFGFLGGIVGYLWYWFTNRSDPKNHVHVIAGIYGTLLSGLLGGLLAIVFDNRIEISIVVGLLNQLIYMALMKSARSKDVWGVIKDVLVRYLTGGKTSL
jgi:hypothetical protein